MDPSIQAAPGYYVWALPGKSLVVHLKLALVDRLSAEVMRGFGAVPKRGAEVGGLLLGTIEPGPQTVVRIEDFEPVPCDYRRGPSYLFTADDGAAFEDACLRFKPESGLSIHAVGYFRSHTREGMSLGPEDIELMEQFFPSPSSVVLLVKPFATKVSVASFFFREEGLFPSAAPLEFPFRYRELTGEEAPPRRSMLERVPRRRDLRTPASAEDRSLGAPVNFVEAPVEPVPFQPFQRYRDAPSSRPRTGWVWLPLSFVFLLLGVVLGFQAALTIGPKSSSGTAEYSLGLTVTRDAANLSVKWNGESPAVRAAQNGTLEIEDGGRKNKLDLDVAQLRNGSILLANSSNTVLFRLTVHPQPDVTIVQILEWKEPPAGK